MSTAAAARGPWWLEEAPPDPRLPPLTRRVDAEFVVVGGGYCGLWTALALVERNPGTRVVLLEAARCGHGPSGRNGGFLHGYWSSLASARKVFGDAGALALARASSRILPAVRNFAAARDEDIWLREGGMLRVAAAPGQEAAVDRAIEAARALGAPEEAVPLSAEGLAARCASPRFRRGVLFRDGATVHPARLARALRRAVLDAGVEVFENSPARVRGTSVETPSGRARAQQVVLAVNSAAVQERALARCLTNAGSHVVLTEPVPDLVARLGWTGGEAIVDARIFLHYFRTTPDGRVLMGSAAGALARGGRGGFDRDRAAEARAEAALRRLLPGFGGVRVEAAWGGPVDVSVDGFPFVGTLDGGRVHYAAGFSGNGVGPSWLAAQALASLATRTEDEWTSLPLVGRRPRRRLPPEPWKHAGGRAVRAATLRVEDADEAGEPAPLWARTGAALPRLLGVRLGTR